MEFYKYEAAGNDFVIVDIRGKRANWNRLAAAMCHRHFGIGADGLITVMKKDSRLYMRIFNADGSEAGVCGNGLRCFAKYVTDYGISSEKNLKIYTPSGLKKATIFRKNGRVNRVRVNMGKPGFKPEEIPVIIENGNKELDIKFPVNCSISVGSNRIGMDFISMGNPHAVHFSDGPVAEYALHIIGPEIETHRIFPQRTNFEIANIIDRGSIRARVWERGVGETLACGSGACAIGVAAIKKNLVNNEVDIVMPGGILNIAWKENDDVFMTGPVKEVFKGEWLK